MAEAIPNELRVDLLGIGALNPWVEFDSSSRQVMFGSHVTQALVVEDATVRRCQTGAEREFGRFTFNVRFPCNAEVIRVIQKYPKTIGMGAIRENPQAVVIYEDTNTREIGVLVVPRHHCKHQHLGFRYAMTPAMNQISPGATFRKGTILADSPSIDAHGNYKYGLEANVALMSVPGIIEDGVIISEAFAKRIKTRGYESRVASWGKKFFPLNLYGDENEYKPFPDIGDRIRPDGLLFAMRPYDELLAPVEMSPEALRTPDYTLDKLVYAEPDARVVDVSVRHSLSNTIPPTPTGMETQTQKYYEAQLRFHTAILEVYQDLKKKMRADPQISPQFQAMIKDALAYKCDYGKIKPKQMYQLQDLDDWRVEVTFEYDLIPTDAFKLTDCHGGR